jgi:hypothetical protein
MNLHNVFWSNIWAWNYYRPLSLREAIHEFEEWEYFYWMEGPDPETATQWAERHSDYFEFVEAAPRTRYLLGGFIVWLKEWLHRLRYTIKP